MANLYTGNGELITVSGSGGGEITNAQIKTALISAVASGDVNLGSAIGATLSYTSPGAAWEANAATAYQNLLTAYKAIPNSGIPFFISTDQHGRGLEQHRWLNNYDKATNCMEVMNLNLGDTVIDVFGESSMSSFYERTWQVKNYIGVFGNHEIKVGGETPNFYDLNRGFISTRGRKFYVGPMGCFTVYDDAHSVKYVCVANYYQMGGGIERGLDADSAEWLVNELAKNDGYDIVYLQHWPVFTTKRLRGEDAETADNENHSGSYNYKIWRLLVARKNKESGTFADSLGGEHTYDFTDCEHDLLITMHGHNHQENISTADGLTAYAADILGDKRRCTFGLIDRLNNKVTFWVFDSTSCLEPLELAI
jgi:hypothetical protein